MGLQENTSVKRQAPTYHQDHKTDFDAYAAAAIQ